MVNWGVTAPDPQPFDVVDANAADVETLFEIYLDVVAAGGADPPGNQQAILCRRGSATGLLSLFAKTGGVDDRSGRSLLLVADGPKTRGCREKRDGQDLKPDREVHPESVPRASADD
jgi:hypothetical protein